MGHLNLQRSFGNVTLFFFQWSYIPYCLSSEQPFLRIVLGHTVPFSSLIYLKDYLVCFADSKILQLSISSQKYCLLHLRKGQAADFPQLTT